MSNIMIFSLFWDTVSIIISILPLDLEEPIGTPPGPKNQLYVRLQ